MASSLKSLHVLFFATFTLFVAHAYAAGASDKAIFVEGTRCRIPGHTENSLNESPLPVQCWNAYRIQFSERQITSTDIRGSVLDKSNFIRSRLDRVDADESSMNQLRFDFGVCRNSSLAKANLRGMMAKMSEWNNCSLEGADLRGAKFWNAKLVDVNLRKATLRGAFLVYTHFEGADLRGANLLDVVLHMTSFKGSIFDKSTQLPFSEDEALRRGMIKQ